MKTWFENLTPTEQSALIATFYIICLMVVAHS